MTPSWVECFGLLPQLFFYLGIRGVGNFIEERQRFSFLVPLEADPREVQVGEVLVRGDLEIMLPGDLRRFPIGVRHSIKRFRVSSSIFRVGRSEPTGFAKLKQGTLQQFRRIDLPGRRQIIAEDEFDVREIKMIKRIRRFQVDREEELLSGVGHPAETEIRPA